MLLLAAGTILGAWWASKAWGRFWSWDQKEVLALVTLLVYLAFLHGRYAGWLGNFGLAAGSVVGATMIIIAWYGANYWFPSGRHAYASGAGGQEYVLAAILADWLFLGLAGFYAITFRRGAGRPVVCRVGGASEPHQEQWGGRSVQPRFLAMVWPRSWHVQTRPRVAASRNARPPCRPRNVSPATRQRGGGGAGSASDGRMLRSSDIAEWCAG